MDQLLQRTPSSPEAAPAPIDIVGLAFEIVNAVARLRERVRQFYYEVMLSGLLCPACQGRVEMVREGRCRCTSCAIEYDPTTTFQRCLSCGGTPRVRVRRYECSRCGAEIVSWFLFDGLVFDADYFRQKMAEHRQRQAERRERVRQMLAECRSPPLQAGVAELDGLPDLVAALNSLTAGPNHPITFTPRDQFDLRRYETHVEAHLEAIPITFDQIPPLSEDTLRDRVWRFIAVIFLAHAGILDVRQDGPTILVTKHEADGERQAIPGAPASADGLAGLVG